jgi:hypothetical protein
MLFDLAQTSRVSPREIRTIIRNLRSSQKSAVCFEKGYSKLPKGDVLALLLLCHSDQSRFLRKEVRIFSLGARECAAYVLQSQRL